ncbi:MAG: HAMP domain-containing sensor histidine kinase [Pseudomonadota bacterium]
MHTRAIIALLLIVLLPLGLLSFVGIRMMHNEQQAQSHRLQVLMEAQLTTVEISLQDYFDFLSNELRVVNRELGNQADELRQLSRDSGQVRQVFMLEPDGERLYPSVSEALTQQESSFLQRTQIIWPELEMLAQSQPAESAGEVAQKRSTVSNLQRLTTSRRSAADNTEVAEARLSPIQQGWYVWFGDTRLNHIFWQRDAAGYLRGFELEPVRLLADMIAWLPSTGAADEMANSARIHLLDTRNEVIYAWGEYQPPKSQKAIAMRPLGHPLGSWKLEYYAPLPNSGGLFSWTQAALVFVIIGIAVGGLAVSLYREQIRAARLARQRVNFVNQVSHELKTPLTNIRLYAELLAEEEADNPVATKFIDVITLESQRLSRLIGNVLNFSRSQRETLQLKRQLGCVDDVIQATLDAFQPALTAKNIVINFKASAGNEASFDADILEQILNNLFSNVEKYASSGGVLNVESAQADECTSILVADRGPGVPKREQGRIFEPFYRISDKLSDGVAGTGIGLSIVRELAHLHGGDVQLLDSEQGAHFLVKLQTI